MRYGRAIALAVILTVSAAALGACSTMGSLIWDVEADDNPSQPQR